MTASMMSSLVPGALARFQDDFAHALLAPAGRLVTTIPPEMAALAAQPAFAVYRNTVMKGCIDALQANYPAVTRLVGEEWLRAAAAIHVREALPADPTLLRYGTDFITIHPFPWVGFRVFTHSSDYLQFPIKINGAQ